MTSTRTCPRCGEEFEPPACFCPSDGAELEPTARGGSTATDPYAGKTVAGDVEILELAGEGAAGRVYRAHQRGVDRDVAVKILRPELSGNAQIVRRFHREAAIASRLRHPHVVEVYTTGQLDDGALFIVMEFLEGMSLEQTLAAAGRVLPLERALAIVLQLAAAVGEAHAQGIVHRDLKPDNVMLVRRGGTADFVKVLDFGIAKVTVGEQSMATAAGLVFGTPRYISPEGARGGPVGPPGDVYSLATILYALLAGRTPFDAEQAIELLVKHLHEPAPDLRSWPPAAYVPEPVARVVMDNLAKDPARRAADGRAFVAALAAAAVAANLAVSGVGLDARASAMDISVGPRREPTLDDAVVVRASRNDPKRPYWRLMLVVSLMLLAVFAVGQAVIRRHAARDAQIALTRRALADGRYVSPPNDCVRDLVLTGLERWPDDPELLEMRANAAMELVTRSMVAQKSADVVGARELARQATELNPTDRITSMQLKSTNDAFRVISADGASTTGPACLVFDAAPTLIRPGERVVVSARVLVGERGPSIDAVKATLFDHRDPDDAGAPVALLQPSFGRYETSIDGLKPGHYELVFSATVNGRSLRAERDLFVVNAGPSS